MDGLDDLPLFSGLHIARDRFRDALDRLDLKAALADAPAECESAVRALAGAVRNPARLTRSDLQRLASCEREGWPPLVERAWQRLVGRCLDRPDRPQTLEGQPAGAFFLRGGEPERAGASLQRHLAHQPRDSRAWAVYAGIDPIRAAVRSAFHGGPVLSAADPIAELVEEDALEPVGPWLLSYAWFADRIPLDEIRRALEAEEIRADPPLPIPNDARAFAWYLLDAGGRIFALRSVGVIEARARLQRISPVAFRRYLARVGGRARK